MADWRPPGLDDSGSTPPPWHPPGIVPGVTKPLEDEAPPSDTPATDAALDDAVKKAFPPRVSTPPPPNWWDKIWSSNAWTRATEAARGPVLPPEMAGGLADVASATWHDIIDPKKAAERAAVSMTLPPPLAIMYPQMKGFLEASAQHKPPMEMLSSAVPEVGMAQNLFKLPFLSREWFGKAAIPLGLEAMQVGGPILEGISALSEIPHARFQAKMAAKPDVVYPEGPAMSAEEAAAHQERYDAAAEKLRAQGGDPVQVARDLAQKQGVPRVRWDHLADAVEQAVEATKPKVVSPLREGDIEAGSRYDAALAAYDEWADLPTDQRGDFQPPLMSRGDWDHATKFATQLQDGDLLEDIEGNIWRALKNKNGKFLIGIGPDGEWNGVQKNLYGGMEGTGGFNPSGIDTLSQSRRIDAIPPMQSASAIPSITPKGTTEDVGRWAEQQAAARQRWEDIALSGQGGQIRAAPGSLPFPRDVMLPGNETLAQLAAQPARQRPTGPWAEISPKDVPKVASLQRRLQNNEITRQQYDAEIRELQRPKVPGGRPTKAEAAAEAERFKQASPAAETRKSQEELGATPLYGAGEKESISKVGQERLGDKPAPKATFRSKTVTDDFGGESTPVAKYVMDSGGILSRGGARALKKLGANKDLWEGEPKFSHAIHRRKIFTENGRMPDHMATDLYNEGLLKENSVPEMYRALEGESRSARAAVKSEKLSAAQEKAATTTAAKQDRDFQATQKELSKDPNAAQILTAELGLGDKVNVDGQEFKVVDIDPDRYVATLEDGRRFGVQEFTHDEIIWGEHEPAPIEGGETSAQEPDETAGAVPTEQRKPPVGGAAGEAEARDTRDTPAKPVATPERPVAPETAPPETEELGYAGLSKDQLSRVRSVIDQWKPGQIFETPEGQQFEASFSKAGRPLLNELDEKGEMTGYHEKARGKKGMQILSRAGQVMSKGLRKAGEGAKEFVKDQPPSPAEEEKEPRVKAPIQPPSPLTTVFKTPAAKPAPEAQMKMANTIEDAFKGLHAKQSITAADPVDLSTRELIEGGHAAIAKGVNPLAAAISDRIPPAQKYAVVRAHSEDLRGEAMRLDDIAQKSRDAADKGRAEIAFQKYHNWKVETEKPVEFEARSKNPGMSPEVPYDIRNFTDYREHFENANKRQMKPNEIAYGRKLVKDKIEKTNLDLRKAIDDYSKRLGDPQRKIASDDDLRARTADEFKKMFPCE